MNPNSEHFEELRRLLALKRHERPHPRYFSQFSQQVIDRIEAGERGERAGFWQHLSWDAPWLQRLWATFETKPILAATVGCAACALLITGVVLSDRTQNSEFALPQGINTPFDPPIAQNMAPVPAPAPETETIGVSSMNGLAISQPQGSLFQQLERERRQPWTLERVNFTPGN